MKKLFKKFYNIIMMTLHVIFYVFDIACTALVGKLNLASNSRCYEETINAIARLCKATRRYVSIERCNQCLDTIYVRDTTIYYDVIDCMNC